MEQLRAWTLSFCFACIVAGLLGQLSAERGRFPVIKLVLTLYIVTAVLAQLPKDAAGWMPEPSAPVQAVPAPDTQALALEAARQELSRSIGQALDRAQIAHGAVDVRLILDGENAEVDEVTVTVPPGQPADGVKETVARVLGADVTVVLREEGS